jgi:hypothetical protein
LTILKQSSALLILFLATTLLFVESAATSPARTERDAKRVRTGKFTYRDLDHGKEVGRGTITIRGLADSQDYAFAADIKFATDFESFSSQRWEAITTSHFEPVSAKLALVRGAEVIPVLKLAYSSGRVSGYVVDRKAGASGTKQMVDSAVPANTVDQRIDWAAILATSLEPGRHFEFNVYDPTTGVGTVSGQVGQVETIKIPAGSYRAYRIIYQMEKVGKSEHYEMFASFDSPHLMLREQFPNGVISELVEHEQ